MIIKYFKNMNMHILTMSESTNTHMKNYTGQSWILIIPNTDIVTAQKKDRQINSVNFHVKC